MQKLRNNDLRERAEKMLAARPPFSLTGNPNNWDDSRLLHELEVYQIELELQNEALVEALCVASLAQEKTEALYDLAPVGFFGLNEERFILEANKRGASMLGLEAPQAIGRHLGAYIAEESLNAWEAVFNAASGANAEAECYPALLIRRGTSGSPIYVQAIARKITDPDTGGSTIQMVWMEVSGR
jgi:PAS domain S-box-containing protein